MLGLTSKTCSTAGRCLHIPRQHPRALCSRRGRLTIKAVGWDPEGILAQPRGGHIQRRTLQKQIAEDKELQEQMDKKEAEMREELQRKRDARSEPKTNDEIINYFLDTEAKEMHYEIARCRPLLSPDFFSHLQTKISEERFNKVVNEDLLAELEAVKQFLEQGTKDFDARSQQLVAPLDRMKKLLMAQDKKAMLLEMAGNNEIDQPLLDLLQQNIEAAQAAGQEDPAKFMQKIRDAAQRYLISK
eukprot:jgi/Astpho2/907/e_gw1.00016.225.1_t